MRRIFCVCSCFGPNSNGEIFSIVIVVCAMTIPNHFHIRIHMELLAVSFFLLPPFRRTQTRARAIEYFDKHCCCFSFLEFSCHTCAAFTENGDCIE